MRPRVPCSPGVFGRMPAWKRGIPMRQAGQRSKYRVEGQAPLTHLRT